MAAALVFILAALAAGVHSQATRVIVDTDMSVSCDDVGALCLLHAMMDNGEAEILGVVHDTGLPTGVGAISVINTYYGRPEIPIGAYKGSFAATEAGPYVNTLVEKFPSPIKNYTQVPDAVRVYRQILSQQDYKSVWIVSIGFATNLVALINSRPDDISPMTGLQMLDYHVAGVAWMGGQYPRSPPGEAEWNFAHDGIGPETLLSVSSMPKSLELMFSGFELGEKVATGGVMTDQTPEANPCRAAYILSVGPGKDELSWDLVTALYAVSGLQPLWSEVATGYNNVTETGDNVWIDDGVDHSQAYMLQLASPANVSAVINAYLVQPPLHR